MLMILTMFMMINDWLSIPWSNPSIERLVHVCEIANCLPHCFFLLRSIHLSVIVVAITWLVQSFWLYFRNIQIQTLFSSPVFAPNGFYILFLDCRIANETCLSLVPKHLQYVLFWFGTVPSRSSSLPLSLSFVIIIIIMKFNVIILLRVIITFV